jgi:methylenetetrahydrofolate reductase (NADPH)
VPGASGRPALADLLKRPRYEVFPVDGIADAVVAHVPTDVKIAITSSPTRGIDATLRLCEQLSGSGFAVAPHLAARAVRDERHLQEILERLDAIGIRDAFVIAGDLKEPAGKFSGAVALLAAMADLGHGLAEVGISGYPESHPFISDETTIQVMFDKEPFATYIVSQLCLDARVIAWWIGAVRARGVRLPIHIGIAGPIASRKLLRIATRIGVGESARFLRGRGGLVTRLFLRGRYGPYSLIERLAPAAADPANGVAGFHVYTFNEVATTETWRRELLKRLA